MALNLWENTGFNDLINQRQMLLANSAAYKRLLKAEETGSIKQTVYYRDLLSDKLFNDYYDTSAGKVKTATYSPDSTTVAQLDAEDSVADHFESMRRLALAAVTNPNSLTDIHYDLFEKMRKVISDGLVRTGGSESNTVVVEEAAAGQVTATIGNFHLLVDAQEFTVEGALGNKTYSFGIGESIYDMASQINADSAETGVKAKIIAAEDGTYQLQLTSTGAGADQFVRVTQVSGAMFGPPATMLENYGTDETSNEAETIATGDQTFAAMAVGIYSGTLLNDQTFTITGNNGNTQFTFAAGTTVEDMVAEINALVDELGVEAEVIYDENGDAVGLGLMSRKAGSGQFVRVRQDSGDLFADAGKTVSVTGYGSGSESGPAITSLADLGRVSVKGVTYSFADLAMGGKASLSNNPNAALAVIEQALQDIYSGRAEIKGFDPEEFPVYFGEGVLTGSSGTNVLEIGNFGSDAISQWLSGYVR